MAYRYDEDLIFLSYLENSDLDDLVKTLIYDKDDKKRYSEHLSTNEKYLKFSPNHTLYWEEIAEEIQRYGANSVITHLFRGRKGVLYHEVLTDVCDKLKVNYNKKSSIEIIEDNLLMKILHDAIDKMSPEERAELAKNIGLKVTDFNFLTVEALMAAFQTIFKIGGFKSYQLTLIIVNAVSKAIFGRGLTLAGNVALTRTASILTGPIGWVILGLWTVFDIAGPAYRVTIPATVQIALLRKKAKLSKEDLRGDFDKELF